MSVLIPDFLRGVVSAAMNILLMISLLKPKYSKRVTYLVMAGILIVDILTSASCYLSGNLTLLAKLDLILFTILCFVVRPLFQDSFMQWLFSYITVQNINMSVVVLSFSLSRPMPYYMYANALIRLLLFSGIIIILHRYVRPLYRQIVEHWNVFFYVSAAILAAFAYYIISSDNIVKTLTEQAVPMHLLVLITVTAYVSVFYSLKTVSREYALREENLQMQNREELLHLSASSMADRIKLLDEAQNQSRITAHDHRHFNNTILELLEQQKTKEAIAFLRLQSSLKPTMIKDYCENTVVNAAVCYYARMAEEKGITTEISLDIPDLIQVNSLELAMVLSNLMENAIHACEILENGRERIICFSCRHVGRLLLEIRNPCEGSVALDENGCPVASESGHGMGTKSVRAFAAKNDAELLYHVADGDFRVRMLI